MSLNGLENERVKQAHEDAIAQPGGWMLLQYVNRDDLEILRTGAEGIAEMRNAIAQYDDETPLYGFLRYRKRSILIKVVPEDCSRLLLARTKVHFVAVTEFFAPYDLEYQIANSDELQETALTTALSRHTSSTSPNFSSSSRIPLEEIEESREEEVTLGYVSTDIPQDRISRPTTARPVTATSALSSHPPNLSNSTSKTRSTSVKKHDLDTSPPPPRNIVDSSHSPIRPSLESRDLSTSSSQTDLYGSPTRPKVRLAPRPSTEAVPTLSATAEQRPISTLPAGLKLFPRKQQSFERPQSQMNSTKAPSTTSANAVMVRSDAEPGRPATSSGTSLINTRSAIVDRALPSTDKIVGMTPEKARLMKALQMRKNRQGHATPPPTSPLPPLPGSANPIDKAFGARIPATVATTDHVQNTLHEDTLRLLKEMAAATAAAGATEFNDIESDATRTISVPASPSTSDKNSSTQASSISDSTDGTVQESRNDEEFQALKDGNVTTKSEIGNICAQTSHTSLVPENPTTEIKDTEGLYPSILSQEPLITQNESEKSHPELSTSFPEQAHQFDIRSDTSGILNRQTEHLSITNGSMEIPHTKVTSVKASSSSEPNAMSKILEIEMNHAAEPKDINASFIALPPSPTDNFTEVDVSISPLPSSPARNLSCKLIRAPAALSEELSEIGRSMPSTGTIDTKTPQTPSKGNSGPNTRTHTPNPTITRTPPSEATTQPDNRDISLITTSEVEDVDRLNKGTHNDNSVQNANLDSSRTIEALADRLSAVSPHEELIQAIEATTVLYSPKGNRESVQSKATASDATDGESLSDDDDLMEELHSASVQQAQPIRVSKSPIRPFFSRVSPRKNIPMDYPKTSPKKSPGKENRHSRSYGSRYGDDKRTILRPISQNGDVSRSSSAGSAYLKRLDAIQKAPSLTKNVKVGSSISQRIKALQSNLAPDATPTSAPITQNATPAFFSVKRASLRRNGRSSPSTLEKVMVDNIIAQRNTPSPSEMDRPLERADSAASRRTNMSFVRGQSPHGETITSTIHTSGDHERVGRFSQDNDKMTYEYRPLELRQSPLMTDQRRHERTQPSIVERRQSRDIGRDTKDHWRASATIRDLLESSRHSISVTDQRQSLIIEPTQPLPTLARPISIHQYTQTSPFPESPRLSSHISDFSNSHSLGLSPNLNNHAPTTQAMEFDDNKVIAASTTERKANRASRLMTRVSNSLSSGRNSIAQALSPTNEKSISDLSSLDFSIDSHQEKQSAATVREPDLIKSLSNSDMVFASTPIPVTVSAIGDFNVQFPDTLLWKRRFVSVDTAGYIIVAQSQSVSAKLGTASKKIHLAEFKTPFVPDEDCMEMPNSVVLEWLSDARQLQIACIGRSEQHKVLKSLKDAHANWATEGL